MLKHHINSVSGEYIKSTKLPHKVGYTTSQPLPEVELAENEYFAMLDADGKVQYWPDDTECTWQVKTRFEKVNAYLKLDCTQKKEFDDKTLVTEEYTLLNPTSQFDEWDGAAWVKNLDLAFNAEMNALNKKHYQDVLSATNQYNIAVARDGSTESDKVATARAILADLDAQFELDQLAIITKYYGA